jgi:hypothetical protein
MLAGLDEMVRDRWVTHLADAFQQRQRELRERLGR